MSKQKVTVTIEARGGGAVAELPIDVPAVFGGKRVPVVATVNGHSFRTTIAVYGGRYYVGFNKEVRTASGVEVGDRVTLSLARDDSPRVVEVPDDMSDALRHDPAAAAAFEKLSYTHRKEYVRWITEAKKIETRQRRIERALEMLDRGVKTPD
ncbi:MAG TPA: YdeI/OmpD-associated family protein [Actinomycetota bacterium]|nr:YdeI/OmpD-associated family protein [Actinomycetota bacterium]